jgi:multicopper oxidase
MRRRRSRYGVAAALAAVWGLAVAAPAEAGAIGMVCTNGPTFNLVTKSGSTNTPDGNSVFMWGFGDANSGGTFQMPGPVLCVNQGNTVTINLHNTLAEPVSIVFPGQAGVNGTGGPGLFAAEAAPGGDASYTFVASQPGTYLYESGSNPAKQVEMGLYGALVVRPAGHPDWAYNDSRTQFDPSREYILMFSEIDPELHHVVETGTGVFDIDALHNRYFTVNGREFPDTIQDNFAAGLPGQPYGALVRMQPYNASTNPLPALIRMVNAGLLNHPFHPHGNHLRMIAQDGRLFLTPGSADASSEHFAETIPSGATEDLLIKWTDQDSFSPTNPFPTPFPSYRNLLFKDNNTWYSGSPYIGFQGTLPADVRSQNVCGELYFPWHSHALNEFTNFDEGFGGMATLLRVDPLGGCFAFPASTKILVGTLKSGTVAALGADDATYYAVNSTTIAPRRSEWYAGFTGVPAGLTNLKVTYKGKNSLSCVQTLSIWKWATNEWVQFDSRSVGAADVSITGTPPAPASAYRGTGTSAGQLRVRVACSGPAAAWVSSGNLMKIVYDAP